MTQMDKAGTAADLAQHKSTVVLILKWERERPHFKHRLVNHLARDCGKSEGWVGICVWRYFTSLLP